MVNGIIILMYVDYSIIVGPSISKIDRIIQSLKDGNKDFVMTDKGDIDRFIGIKIMHLGEKRFNISQPLLINRIIYLLNIDTNTYGMDTNTKSTPVVKPLLYKDLQGNLQKEKWEYRTAVGMLTYHQANNRP